MVRTAWLHSLFGGGREKEAKVAQAGIKTCPNKVPVDLTGLSFLSHYTYLRPLLSCPCPSTSLPCGSWGPALACT